MDISEAIRLIESDAGLDDDSVVRHFAETAMAPRDRHRLMDALASKGRTAEAARLVRAPEAPEAAGDWLILAALLEKAGRSDSAHRALQHAAALKPEMPDAYFRLGGLWFRRMSQPAFREALAPLRHARVIAPDAAEVEWLLVYILFLTGGSDEALWRVRELLSRRPQDANALSIYAVLLYEKGLDQETLHTLQRLFDGTGGIYAEEAGAILTRLLLAHGLAPQGLAYIRNRLSRPGASFALWECLAELEIAAGQRNKGTELCRRILSQNPARSRAYAALCMMRLREESGERIIATRRPHAPLERSVALSSIDHFGRFAHQVNEYILTWIYAREAGLSLETPDWIGHLLFDLDDPPARRMPVVRDGNKRMNDFLFGRSRQCPAGVDFFSPDPLERFDARFRTAVQERLRFRPVWHERLAPLMEGLRADGRTVVALHLRRGDMTALRKPPPMDWYIDWLRGLWTKLERPVLYLCSDELDKVRPIFAEFKPVSLNDVAVPWEDIAFVQDFYVLANADVVGVSDGNFARLAALLNTRATLFGEADPAAQAIIPYAPWLASFP